MSARDVVQGAIHFDGPALEPELDTARLGALLGRVKALMLDHRWRTLGEIRGAAGGSEAGVSARLRDLRKVRFGAYAVDRRRRGAAEAGLWEYRVTFRQVGP